MDKKEFSQLAERVSTGLATDAEIALYNLWCNTISVPDSWNEKELGNKADKEKQLYDDTQSKIRIAERTKKHRLFTGFNFSVAAALLIAVGAVFYFYPHFNNKNASQQDIAPGGNYAYLTLANGKRISLNNAANGTLATEAGVKITKSASGQLIYEVLATDGNGPQGYHTIETPKGGQYQLRLPDGTQVWLNASSSLKYPSSFNNTAQRRVELQGEAYFEVSHQPKHPFTVKTDWEEVQVLGTHFNVNAYDDEESVNTTLLAGSVNIYSDGLNTLLNPGQEAVLGHIGRKLKVQAADIEMAMAWKNGDFIFKQEKIESIMRKLSRWYNVDIVYADDAPKSITLGGWVSRSKNISAVLNIMELTEKVHFKVEGRRITVMK